jgi:ABC-2 type transport system permease protein
MNDVAVQLREAGKYPLDYFSRSVRLVLRTIVPAGLIAATPVDVLTGKRNALWIGAAVLVAALAVTAVHWRAAIRKYSSASS